MRIARFLERKVTVWMELCVRIDSLEKLLGRRNDPGLLSEGWDAETGHFMGNFPQALSRIALISATRVLSSL